MNEKCPRCPMSFICLTHETRVLRCACCKQQCVFELTKRGGVVEHGYHMMSEDFCLSDQIFSRPYHYVCFDCGTEIFKRFISTECAGGVMPEVTDKIEEIREQFHLWRIRIPFFGQPAKRSSVLPSQLQDMLLQAGEPA